MKCLHCDEEMSLIRHGFKSEFYDLEDENGLQESARLFVCTSRDCSHCGIVMAIPVEGKD